jgi:hypothetical protein
MQAQQQDCRTEFLQRRDAGKRQYINTTGCVYRNDGLFELTGQTAEDRVRKWSERGRSLVQSHP